MNNNKLKVAIAQISPVWLNKTGTLKKIMQSVSEASTQGAELVVFGEALLPGYPFWVSLTGGAAFNNKMQKEMYAHYVENAVQIEKGDLDELYQLAKEKKIAVYLGIIERAKDRGNHSLYCSLVYISNKGILKSVHRKLQPTYEERLVWAQGDGNGLQVHSLKNFTLGGLNCWENWMPLARATLYALGENVHIAVWPGGIQNTQDITKFIAKESRSYVISASALLNREQITNIPHAQTIINNAPKILANGGSCIASPDGEFLVEPIINKETIIVEELDFSKITEERLNFDASGHYSRPDVTQLTVNFERLSILKK